MTAREDLPGGKLVATRQQVTLKLTRGNTLAAAPLSTPFVNTRRLPCVVVWACVCVGRGGGRGGTKEEEEGGVRLWVRVFHTLKIIFQIEFRIFVSFFLQTGNNSLKERS